MPLSRRQCLSAGLSIAATTAFGSPALAAGAKAAAQGPGVYRSKLGSYQLTALYDGWWPTKIGEGFVRNASAVDVNAALAAGFLPPDVLPLSFTALLVNTGAKLVLIDTGTAGQLTDSAGSLLDNLAVAGVKPATIDTILISHFHPDHINGLKSKDGSKIFPNAEILVPEGEWAFWMNESNMKGVSDTVHHYFLNARRIFRDIAGEIRRFKPGGEIAPGITSIAAYGHTPGHAAFVIASGNETLMVISDSAREPWLFVRHPEWQPSYDMDGPAAVETRKRLLDRAAADRMPVHGYHFPFPAFGHIAKTATGFDLVPVMWQPL